MGEIGIEGTVVFLEILGIRARDVFNSFYFQEVRSLDLLRIGTQLCIIFLRIWIDFLQSVWCSPRFLLEAFGPMWNRSKKT